MTAKIEYEEARAKKVAAEAEIAELELAKVKGELVDASDVVTAWSDVLASIKARLISIPSKAAPIVSAEDSAAVCQSVLEDLVREALDELSNYNPQVDPSKANVSSEATASEPEPKKRKVGRPRKTAKL